MKLAIVVDSSCGLTKKQAEKKGWHFLPLYINIDGKEYKDGIDINVDNFFDICKDDSVVKTSCTPIGESLQLIEKLSKENDFVVVYPISMGLSSQQQNLEMISKEFKNVFVVKSKNVCQLIVKDLIELEKDVLSNEMTVKQAIAKIEKFDYSQATILLYPREMNALVKGGRLSPSAAKMAKLLKIFPVIGFQDGKLEKFDKGVTFSKTFFNTSVPQYKKLAKKGITTVMFLDAGNEDADGMFEEFRTKVDYKEKTIFRFKIPPVVAAHTGRGSISVFFTKLDKEPKTYKFD